MVKFIEAENQTEAAQKLEGRSGNGKVLFNK
jgi:hypothetical protein